jgi:hypothetical protein
VERLQIELLNRLGGHKPHGRPLDGLGNGFGVAEVVLVALAEGITNWTGISFTSWPSASN